MFYSNIILVEGSKNIILVDLQKDIFHRIPSYVISVERSEIELQSLTKSERNSYLGYKELLNKAELVNSEISKSSFPNINLDFEFPSHISNAVFHLSELNMKYVPQIISQLIKLNTKAIIMSDISLSSLINIIAKFKDSYIRFIDLYIGTIDTKLIKEKIQDIFDLKFVRNVIYFDKNHKSGVIRTDGFRNLVNLSRSIDYSKSCGVVDPVYFTSNMKSFTEAINHNSCLNRKISIDANGDIRNCLSMSENFGNISNTTLREAIEKPGFKKYWDITKDDIHVCKDCEFRYICTDCRAYVEDPEDILSKPLKCGYNPYTGEWSEWSTNPLKQKAIDFYGMREMVEARQTTMNSDSSET